MEGHAASRLGRAGPDRHCGGAGMTPVATTFFFYFLSGLAIISGILVITSKNLVHSALALIFTLLALARHYLLHYSAFVAGVSVILFAVDIIVLFRFVIMIRSIDNALSKTQF